MNTVLNDSGVPVGETGCNAYRLRLAAEREIVLWGFGVFCGAAETGGAYFARCDFAPRFSTTATIKLPIWKKEQLPVWRNPRTSAEVCAVRRLTARLISWILSYETWIAETCGGKWRRNCLKSWENTALSGREIRRGWTKLLKSCERRLI